jgi:hypothetical protein
VHKPLILPGLCVGQLSLAPHIGFTAPIAAYPLPLLFLPTPA